MKTRFIPLALAMALAVPAAHGAQNIDRTAKTGASPAVEISNVQGHVTVTGWDRQEVKVTGVIDNDKDEFEFSADDKRVVIKVRPEKGTRVGRNEARLDVRVPEGSALDVQTVSADVKADGVRGAQRLESVSGDIDATVTGQSFSLRTISGDATIRGQGGKADVTLASVSGGVTATGLRGDVEAKSVSGDLDLEVQDALRLRMKTISGGIKARAALAGEARAEVESISGGVRLDLAKPVNAEFDVESHSGSIDNCFGPQAQRKSNYGPGRELRFTQGSGAAKVRIDTLSGRIEFCDR